MLNPAATFVYEFTERLRGADGMPYVARVYGHARPDGTWEGWLEFMDPTGLVVRTGRETTQSNVDHLTYWATGLEPTYLEGALVRALRRQD